MADKVNASTKKGRVREKPGQRSQELLKNAQIAYDAVPSQQEMLTGGTPIPEDRERKAKDRKLTEDIDDALYEAAQQGNIGGG